MGYDRDMAKLAPNSNEQKPIRTENRECGPSPRKASRDGWLAVLPEPIVHGFLERALHRVDFASGNCLLGRHALELEPGIRLEAQQNALSPIRLRAPLLAPFYDSALVLFGRRGHLFGRCGLALIR